MTVPDWSAWVWAAIAVGVIAIIVLAVFVIRRRRARKQKEKEDDPLPNPWPRRSLSTVYPRFRRGLTQGVRRNLWSLPLFVVTGEQDGGVARLIDSNIDWQLQRLKFAPSDTIDDHVRVHLGANEIAIQLSDQLLEAEPEQVRPSLRHFWRSLPRQKKPTIVFCVDAPRLRDRDDVELARLGAVLRGKINLIPTPKGGGLDVRIHLSRMDDIEGYEDFAAFALRLGIEPTVSSIEALERVLESYEEHLSRALERSAESFAGVARFLEEARPCLLALEPLVDALTIPDKISHPLHLDGISFSATNGELQVGRPFSPPGGEIVTVRTYQKQAMMRAAAVLSVLALLSTGAYWRQYDNLTDAGRTLSSFSPGAEGNKEVLVQRLSGVLYRTTAWQRWWPPMRLSYEKLRDKRVKALRKEFQPELSLASEQRRFVEELEYELSDGPLDTAEHQKIHVAARRLTAALWIHELGGDERDSYELHELGGDEGDSYELHELGGDEGDSDELRELGGDEGDSNEASPRARERSAIAAMSRQVRALDLKPRRLRGPTLLDLMRGLDLLKRRLEKPNDRRSVTLQLLPDDIDFGVWERRVVESWASQLVDSLVEDSRFKPVTGSNRYPFFEDPIGRYPAVELSSLKFRALSIPGIYTRAAAEGELAPVLQRYHASVNAWPVSGRDRGRLAVFVEEQTAEYVTSYTENWREHLSGLDLVLPPEQQQVSQRQILRGRLQLPQERSVQAGMIEDVVRNLSPPEDPSPHLAPLWNSLRRFEPLLGPDGTGLPLDGYFTALNRLSDQLAPGDLATADTRRGLGLLEGSAGSPRSEAVAWLLANGVELPDLQAPFLAPFNTAQRVVSEELRDFATSALEPQIDDVRGLATKFPFSKATDEVSVAELEQLLKPGEGTFWQEFETHVAPFCERGPEGWRVKPNLGLRVDPTALAVVDQLERLAAHLWTETGERKAIPISIKPLLMPTLRDPAEPDVIQTSLRFGDPEAKQIFGFNATPRPKLRNWEWWNSGDAAVAIKTRDSLVGTELWFPIERFNSPWSFLRILEEAEIDSEGTAIWHISVKRGGPEVAVSFQLDSDPLSEFRAMLPGRS